MMDNLSGLSRHLSLTDYVLFIEAVLIWWDLFTLNFRGVGMLGFITCSDTGIQFAHSTIAAVLALKYFKVCLFTKCEENNLIFQPLVFVLGFAILTKTWRLVPKQLACHYAAYRLCNVFATIFLTQIAQEYIWTQMVRYTNKILEQLHLGISFLTSKAGFSDYFAFLKEETTINVCLGIEAVLILYYAVLLAASPKCCYRLLKDLFGIPQPNVSCAPYTEVRTYNKKDPSCTRGRSPTRYRFQCPCHNDDDLYAVWPEGFPNHIN